MTPLSHKRPTNLSRFYYGSPYYPEHWDADTRQSDPERMRAAGWNCVRMAEFAWDLIESHEGEFDFSLFDETIRILGEHGIETILCTPTATPPRWLTVRHPDMLRVDNDGRPMQHGSRQHTCQNNFFMRAHSRRITRVMADHYRHNPHVVGWQTDNEINCHFAECHCESCQQAFVDYLRDVYKGDIGALNRAWGTAFWAQTYVAFEDIQTPRENRPTYPNPAQQLDYFRFLAWTAAEFQGEQVTILRDAQPAWFVTHNGLMQHVNYRGKFTRDLDFLGFDDYPMFNFNPETRPASNAFMLDHARGWSGNFMIPEQQSGPGGQAPYFHDNPEPGEMRRLVYESIARGADSLLFFRWRTCRFGAEEYWCGILDHDSVPRRRYAEAAQIGEELSRLGPAVLGTSVQVEAAVAACELDEYDAHRTLSFGLPSPHEMASAVHSVLFAKGWATGCVHPEDNLDGVKLLVIPHWTIFRKEWVENLEQFVESGGLLVIGARTATKDAHNNVVAETLPGVLRCLVGATVEEYGRQNAPEQRPLNLEIGGQTVHTKWWYEQLSPDANTQVLASWSSRYLAGSAGITLHPVGKGAVVYVGTYLTQEIMTSLLDLLASRLAIQAVWPNLPDGVNAVLRSNGERKLCFLINFNDRPVTIPDAPEGLDLLSNQPVKGALQLAAYGVAVVQN
jgi:beta-galactosidase